MADADVLDVAAAYVLIHREASNLAASQFSQASVRHHQPCRVALQLNQVVDDLVADVDLVSDVDC